MTSNKRRGSDAERRLSKVVGGRRNPNTGTAAADVETDMFAYEIKSRKTIPAYIVNAFRQAYWAGTNTGKVPVVVLEHRVQGHARRYYCLAERDWLELHGKG